MLKYFFILLSIFFCLPSASQAREYGDLQSGRKAWRKTCVQQGADELRAFEASLPHRQKQAAAKVNVVAAVPVRQAEDATRLSPLRQRTTRTFCPMGENLDPVFDGSVLHPNVNASMRF